MAKQIYHGSAYLWQQKEKAARTEERQQGGVDQVNQVNKKALAQKLVIEGCNWLSQLVESSAPDKDQACAVIKLQEVLRVYKLYLKV